MSSKLNSTKFLDQNKNIPNKHMVDPASCMNTKLMHPTWLRDQRLRRVSRRQCQVLPGGQPVGCIPLCMLCECISMLCRQNRSNTYITHFDCFLIRQVPDGTRKIQGCLLCLFTMRFLEGMAFKEGRSRLHLASGKSRVP